MWDLSCPDWAARLRAGRSLMPALPLIESEAELGLAIFDEMQLPDVPGKPALKQAAGAWFRDIVRAAFGSWDPKRQQRHIRDILAMAPKGSSKTSYAAALLLAVLVMNKRPNAEAVFVADTQLIAEAAYGQAVGMIEASRDLQRRFQTRDHVRTIVDRVNKTEARLKTFDVNVLTGSILIFAYLDELHLLGRNAYAGKVLTQIRGGLDKTPEGLLVMTTTQSDDRPVGIFRDELARARAVRDGRLAGIEIRPTLPVLYEFPAEIAADPAQWGDPGNWPMVHPNLGRSVRMDDLTRGLATARQDGDHAVQIWASQYLNIEIGVGIVNDAWRGADYWAAAAESTLTLDDLIARSEVTTVGIDGGGLDDLLGLCVIGRELGTRKWLVWSHAYADPVVLDKRKDIAPALLDFMREGSLDLCPLPQAHGKLAGSVKRLLETGLLPGKDAVGVDPNNVTGIFEALIEIGVTDEMIRRLRQGPALSPALWGLEIKLADGTLAHAGLALMAWVVANVKIEIKGNGNQATKQVAGRGKIDPFVAMLCAAIVMSWDPAATSAPGALARMVERGEAVL